MIVVNLFAGPGAGKSTTAAYVFSMLKMLNVNSELVTEYAKQMVWDKRHTMFDDQIYIFAKQHHKQFMMEGQVDVIVTDSPLVLSAVYNGGKFPSLDKLVLECYDNFNNVNVYINRVKPYNPKGRNQDEDGARELDRLVMDYLKLNDIPIHLTIDGNIDGGNQLVNYLIPKVGK